jgi:hypothetical protein
MSSFNVVIATIGRPTLQRMVDSIAPQLKRGDYLTLIFDGGQTDVILKTDATVIQINNSEVLGHYGHASRTRWQNYLPGDYLMNADDDDAYVDGAMDIVREHCTEHKLYVFQMQYEEHLIPKRHVIEFANIGTPCGVYPTDILLPDWPYEYGGDCKFYQSLEKLIPVEFVDKLIYKVR